MKTERTLDLTVLGRVLRVSGARAPQERWFQEHWHMAGAVQAVAGLPAITIRFSRHAPADFVATSGTPVPAAPDNSTPPWREHGARCWSVLNNDSGVLFQLERKAVHIDVWQAQGRRAGLEPGPALHVAICEALRSTGLTPLHAAVVLQAGQATAFLGRSGVGRSTALLGALAHDWQPLAEDLAWLDTATGCVHGWDRGIRITQAGARSFRLRRNEGWKRAAPLRRIAVLQQAAGQHSGWEKLELRDAVRALFESAGRPLCTANRRAFARQVAPLLARVELARLVLGRAPVAAEPAEPCCAQ